MNPGFFSVCDGTVVWLLIVPCDTFRTVFDHLHAGVTGLLCSVVWTRCLDGAKPQVFMSDGKQNSGFNSSLKQKLPLSYRVCCLERWLFLLTFHFTTKEEEMSVAIHNKDNHTKQLMLLTTIEDKHQEAE